MATPTTPMPLRLGTPEDFAAFREILRTTDYTEATLSARLDIPSFAQLGSLKPGTRFAEALDTALDVMIRLLLECEPAPHAQAIALLGADTVDVMQRLGLI